MRKLSIILIASLMLLACFSCHKKSDKEIETDHLTEFIKKLSVKDNVKWIVILPGLGCPGCIQEGEQFMKDNITDKNVYFVLTKIGSIKMLSFKIGVDITKCRNVYEDKDNLFKIPTDNDIYPCIVEIDNGQIVDHEFQNPHNGLAFDNLNARLKAQAQ